MKPIFVRTSDQHLNAAQSALQLASLLGQFANADGTINIERLLQALTPEAHGAPLVSSTTILHNCQVTTSDGKASWLEIVGACALAAGGIILGAAAAYLAANQRKR